MIATLSLMRNNESKDERRTVSELDERLGEAGRAVARFASSHEGDFRSFEKELMALVWGFARLAVTLFLAARHERCVVERVERDGRVFRPAPAQARNFNCFFGVVRYWRTYLREVADGDRHGFYPLDVELGLSGDRISFGLLTAGARLALKLSFAEARSTLGLFVPTAPSVEVIEQTVLGLGRYTEEWFQQAGAPEGDGPVMVVMIDSKGAPTATESELVRRRGKRKKRAPRYRAWTVVGSTSGSLKSSLESRR